MSSRRDLANPSLLSPSGYDDDADSLRSPSEQDSDSEDDKFIRASRTTLELSRHDQTVLEDEEETENLLTRSGPTHGLRRIFSPNRSTVRIGKTNKRRSRRSARHGDGRRHRGELMFEMEEGHRDDESSLLSSESDLDEDSQEKYPPLQV